MKTIYKYSAAMMILIAAQILAGCKVSKDIALPDTSLPKTYRNAPVDSLSVGALPWKSFFEDEELKSLIADALEHNYDLQVAVKNIEAAELAFKQSKLGNVPTVGIQATASTSRPSDNSLNGLSLNQYLGTKHIEDYTIAASLSWEADIWGKIRSQKAAALASFLSTQEARKAVQTRIVSDISKGYYNLLMLDSQLGIARRNVKLNDSTLTIIKLQYSAGQVTTLAVQQAEAQKLTAEGLVPQFEQQIAVQENAISVLSGRLPSPVGRDISLESLSLTEKLSTGMPSELLSRRPDVKRAELELSRANANVGYSKANMYPSLTIGAQGGLDAIKASNWFNIPASLFGVVTGGIAQPLFDKKRLSTLYQVAKVNREASVLQFRQSVLVAYQEVSDALVKLDKLKQQQALATERTATLQQATHNSQQLFKNGLATYLEVITAQGNVLQSELELASIKKARLDATVDLYRSLGGGWN
ncbi:efflux transporter outer membrane subunit [Mucilaginibacter aquaedulcis]|uniref:efflux transporter outer membrane subunit n=1 Tax=Mucilaginibacter aquaedulcis TaxID=1187081 RepID=UPI0025B5D921|nr:efflux transporter outer membrane subunit [Mucilaginibacter aquaedulcis]MDN3548871.1 efflux transporter outer membrane subunit [Mucilaginibacter aquaedulcis]